MKPYEIQLQQAQQQGWGTRAKDFTDYMQQIDTLLDLSGVSSSDADDFDFAGCFENGIPVEICVRDILVLLDLDGGF